MVQAATAGGLSAATAFTAISLFNILRFPLNNMPNTIQRVVDISVTMRRLSNFMTAAESRTLRLDERSPDTRCKRGKAGEEPTQSNGAATQQAFDGYFRSDGAATADELAIEVAVALAISFKLGPLRDCPLA